MIYRSAPQSFFIRLVLLALVLVGSVRLTAFIVKFGSDSLQMDFSAFYTAGEALDHRLSPHENQIGHSPPIWDGINYHRHSRFLYPPLAANLFQGLSWIPYAIAKSLWMLAGLLALVFSLLVAGVITDLPRNVENLLTIGVVVTFFHPLLTFLERGQIDSVTLAIVTSAIGLFVLSRKRDLWAGGLLAVATWLKLPIVLIVPFLVMRSKWKALMGYGVGSILLLAISLTLNGAGPVEDYWLGHLPRIVQFGEGGTSEMLLSDEILQGHLEGVPEGFTKKDNHIYHFSCLGFVAKASLTEQLVKLADRVGLSVSRLVPMLLVLAFCLAATVACQVYRDKRRAFTSVEEFVYWQIPLIAVLLSSPLTWVMNVVWLLPVAVVVLRLYPSLQNSRQAICLAGCSIGLGLAALPDHYALVYAYPLELKLVHSIFLRKYVLAELLVLVSLLGLLLVTSGGWNYDNPS